MTDLNPDGVSDKVSFVIASRNRSEELASVVTRLLDTTDCPIIVADNGSADGSVPIMRRIAAQSPERVTLLELGSNLGAVARNVGVAACRTPYVAFCDDDSWWDPAAPALGAEIFDRFPQTAVLAARTEIWPHGREDPLVQQLAASPLGHRTDLPGPSILGFLACSAMVRKSAFQAAGGFSHILHFRGEEQLLALDLAASGWELCYCPELTAVHHPSVNRPTSAAQDARSVRNDVLTTWLRRPLPHCVRASVRLLGAATRDVEHARAATEAVVRLPDVLMHRRRLPATVEQALAVLERGDRDHH
ncbi:MULTISPECIES: glycosyltransferase family 2 protein [Mycolicibacterium]|uniref:Transferase n=1 Tax=Mycolicibacterium senegalense TaxID=1796 RepID=A0A378W2B1_9MYCO|nr:MULTISPECIES: glycosyltransferase family 2 protein [Mycolicibacterium]MCV7336768.1 glycosyltransferase family 2 protein [Mycolicibacterium senegalense]MDR7291656.1 GT2 family glycosyltransferase [Mycolicibacterium senegalense]QZA23116.1 glycosyltransferase [Mycolicibacterium senegalense]CDP84531.1 transferase [Mycolicibacterium farcinogenes]SUA27263.1 transferase [Mycolicibacterium senegalense]